MNRERKSMKNSILYLSVLKTTFKPRLPDSRAHTGSRSIQSTQEQKSGVDFLPAGIVFIVLCGVLGWVFTTVKPDRVNHWFIRDGYLFISLLLFLCFIAGLLFVTRHVRRALMWAFALTLLVWLQFQGVLDVFVLIYIVLPFIFIEFICVFFLT
jgi:hypothetical protein